MVRSTMCWSTRSRHIEKCFQAAGGINQADLKFTYIIVSEWIHTRFFR